MSVKFKDYYETLGVSREATADEIKKAYRRLARTHHPDRAEAARKAEAEERIKEINEAYEVLKDPEKRRRYDELGANWEQVRGGHGEAAAGDPWDGFGVGAGPGGGSFGREFHFGGTGFSDFFEEFFGAGSGRAHQPGGRGPQSSSPRRARAGADVQADLMVELEEAANGATRPVSLRSRDPVSGREESHEFKVRIPPGVRDGQRLRVRGRGRAGDGSGPPGDLLLRVRLAPHPDFRVEGHDLLHELELEPWEATLGTKVTIPTLEGPMRLTIPAGTPPGRKLRVRGRGLPDSRGGARGDLLALVNVRIPEELTAEERGAWETLARVSRRRDER
jgi:curved DNA-binding protein